MSTAAAPGRPFLMRPFLRPDGSARTGRLLVAFIIGAAIVSFASMAGIIASGGENPETLAIVGLATFLGVKVPLLIIMWWMLGRFVERPGETRLTTDEYNRVLTAIESDARAAVGRDDEAARLAYYEREAWRLADGAPEEVKGTAVAVALRVASLGGRRPPP